MTRHHRKSKTSNYSTLTGKEKPLPFNAVRYIANMLKEIKNGIKEDVEINSTKSIGGQ